MGSQVKYVNDCEKGQETVREMTAEEIETEAAQAQKFADYLVELAQEEAQRQADQQVLLDKLGITAEEAKLLLG
jgi:hypothetical protein